MKKGFSTHNLGVLQLCELKRDVIVEVRLTNHILPKCMLIRKSGLLKILKHH